MPRRKKGGDPDKLGLHTGYARPDAKSPWRKVCEGWSFREVWLALVEQTRAEGGDPDLLVIESGKDPSSVPGGLTIFTRTEV